MNIQSVAAALLILSLGADGIAQGGGGGRGRRPEEITNRIGAFFATVEGPAVEGDRVADLGTIDLVRAATGAEQPCVIYLVDSKDDQDVREQFERAVFGNDEIGIELKCFHCGRVDLKSATVLQARYGKQAPLFVVFDAKGKSAELSMAGYKPAATALGNLLERQAAGSVKPSLASFAKSYADVVRDLEQLLAKKKLAEQKLARAGADEGKRAEAEKDLKAAEAEQKKLLEKETALLGKARLPERGANAQRLGGRAERGERGGVRGNSGG